MSESHRSFVSYIDKSRDYYAAQGYDQPYRWASNHDSPFTPLAKPLAECRVGVVTTTKLSPDAPLMSFSAASSPQPESMATNHLSWHKLATTTDDVGSFLPLDHLSTLVAEGVIGSMASRFVGIPTLYSQRRTSVCADEIHAMLVEDDVDLALLIPL